MPHGPSCQIIAIDARASEAQDEQIRLLEMCSPTAMRELPLQSTVAKVAAVTAIANAGVARVSTGKRGDPAPAWRLGRAGRRGRGGIELAKCPLISHRIPITRMRRRPAVARQGGGPANNGVVEARGKLSGLWRRRTNR